jgi:hypothetical protein
MGASAREGVQGSLDYGLEDHKDRCAYIAMAVFIGDCENTGVASKS